MNELSASRALVLSVSIVVALLLTAGLALAAAGDLDPTFGDNGKVITPIESGGGEANAMQIQSDGKIVVAGSGDNGFALARYYANGALDPTFGNGGKVKTPIGSGGGVANAIQIQSNGKIVVAGTSDNGSDKDFALARYDANGTLDSTFGSGGKATTSFGTGYEGANAIQIQINGKIVVAGYSEIGSKFTFALARYDADGALDPTFGTGGFVATSFGSYFDEVDSIDAMQIQTDGKIVVAGQGVGQGIYSSDYNFALARYDTSGALDPTFGTGGKVTTSIYGADCSAHAMQIQTDGKIVVAGETGDGNTEFALARYDTTGALDPNFGSDGKQKTLILGVLGFASAHAMQIQSDGKIVLAGYAANSHEINWALARYDAGGELDPSFGRGGMATTAFGGPYDSAKAMQIQSDGKIVVAGRTYSDSIFHFALARFGAVQPVNPSPPISPPTVPRDKPLASIDTSLSRKVKAKNLKAITGSATGAGLAKVEIAINLANRGLLKKGDCLAVRSASGLTKRFKAKHKKCLPNIWLAANGTSRWSFRLKHKLRPGKYTIYTRAVNVNGITRTTFSAALGNLTTVTVVR